ncbi:hypothetical protein C2G38_2241263 [Gigaspora rosea]|uniref:Uncharacterized protein n=1 Tax=Gigaspora rosea TaxID=44941 RepID=A0A397VXD7_9GLOM|nr:hypothetical protein C2G38_2241263 [Gigaspora rosea]
MDIAYDGLYRFKKVGRALLPTEDANFLNIVSVISNFYSLLEKADRSIEDHLLHLEKQIYDSEKIIAPRSWPECNVFPALPATYVTDSRVQTDNIICDHGKENNRQFMLDIEKEYRERANANIKMRSEIEDLKMQVQEVEKKLASMKLDPIH